MRGYPFVAAGCLLFGAACSGSTSDAGGDAPGAASSDADGMAACGTTTDTLPLTGSGDAPGATPSAPASSTVDDGPDGSPYVTFIDCTTGFSTDEVRDADREIVHFDASASSLVSDASGNSVAGWTVSGADLDWSRSGVRFRVRFGTEAGERRAYFTETGPGTICNLTVAGPDVLFVSATSETPPNP
ncbi:MAG TPA: hypothetical protein VMG12_00930 [Polyangiaceae bacterium]|nr:hypothetical protein [Polyangiaceae bacterium]